MPDLPDPRTLDSRPCPELLNALRHHTTVSGHAEATLTAAVRDLLARGDEGAVRDLLDWRGPPSLIRVARRCVQKALEPSAEDALRVQFFALPVVMVVAGRAPLLLPMVLADAGVLPALFEAAGALGPSRQLGFSASLCDASTLSGLSLVDLYRRARLEGDRRPLELPAGTLEVGTSQSAALRFLVGSVLLAPGAPGFTETAGDAAGWGGALTRELNAQLSLPGVTLLPLARPPRAPLHALDIGRFCREEVAFQLETGGHLRDLRARHGEPAVSLRAGPGDVVEVTLSAVWSSEVRSHRWRLHPETDLRQVFDSIEGFLRACAVSQWDCGGADGRGPRP